MKTLTLIAAVAAATILVGCGSTIPLTPEKRADRQAKWESRKANNALFVHRKNIISIDGVPLNYINHAKFATESE